jgi:putative ABC transport system permease protein
MTTRYARLDGAPGGPRPSPRGAWVKIADTGAAAGVGLALLVLATVAISVALPRFSVSLRTTALRRTLSTVPAASTAVLGNLPYLTFDVEFGGQPFTAADLTTAGTQLAAGLAGQGLPLARPFWSGLSAAFATVTGAGPGTASALPPEMEILYRDQLTRYGRLTAGRFPQQGVTSNGQVVLQVAVTPATAARYGLRPGSRLGMGPDVTLEVTGIVTPVDPGSAFWGVDPIAAAPALNFTPPPASSPYWIGACFIGPAEVPLLQASVPTSSMQVSWAVPLSLAHLPAGQVPALTDQLSGALADGGVVRNGAGQQISGPLAQVPLSIGLLPVLSGFTAEDQAIGAVLGLLFVSLAAIGIVAVVLAAALVAARRGPEFAVMRARGASLRQVTGRALASSATFTLPAAAAGAGLAVLLTPGGSTAISWWLGGCALAAALGGVPLVVVARLRSAGRGRRSARFTPAAASRRMAVVRRLVAEAGLAAAAVGGIIVLRRQGLSAGSVDVYSSAAPVLVAVLAAIVVVHVYPVLLRLLLRLARVRPGVSAFVGLSQATRTAPGAIAVVFALVLALAMVAFGTMIDDAVHRGEVAESWSQVGADAVIYASASSRPATPAVQREIAAVPGAARTAAVPVATGRLSSGANLTVALVNPAAYAALVASTPAPAFPAASLARRPGPVPALVSAGAARQLPPGPGRLTVDGRRLTVRSAGLARAIPGIPAPGIPAGPFVVLPIWALGAAGPAPSVILVVGPHLDTGRLAAVVRRDLPGALVVFRDSALSALTGAPLPAAAQATITASAAAAAAFSALILLISLLISAPSREMTLARLSTMGLGRGQGRWLAGMETLPQVLAAIAGGVTSAWVLGLLIAPSISLSAFTGSASGVAFRTEPLPLVACATGLILLAGLALAVQFLIVRRRGVARPLRVGE